MLPNSEEGAYQHAPSSLSTVKSKKMNDTGKEDRARAELVKLATNNDMYFVVWWSHFGNYFVGVKNEQGLKPEIYEAMYESFYDLTGGDEVMFRFRFKVNDSSSET